LNAYLKQFWTIFENMYKYYLNYEFKPNHSNSNQVFKYQIKKCDNLNKVIPIKILLLFNINPKTLLLGF
jgi:hypothetical protein